MRRILLVSLILVVRPQEAEAQSPDLYRPPLAYDTTPPENAVAALEKRLRSGKAAPLRHDARLGYLPSLLDALKVPPSSQVLVFSRTSLQRARIGPKAPRALYFNDEIVVGFCRQGDVLEIAAADPKLGTAFTTVDQDPKKKGEMTRHGGRCLLCHASSANRGFPGHLLRSVPTDRRGDAVSTRSTRRIDHTTPLADRWAGWYVTGTTGMQPHLGNRFFGPQDDRDEPTRDVTDLAPFFPVADYLTPHSDLVALMVLDHQYEGHNRIAQANLATRLALAAEGVPAAATARKVSEACEPLVEYLLFCGEAPLQAPLAGTSGFAREFAARGPVDSQGRSLRTFDLRKRLFRYPMSYLITTRAFAGLPPAAKDRTLLRLWEVLSGLDASERFRHLSAEDRRAILDILRDTLPWLPDYWKRTPQPSKG